MKRNTAFTLIEILVVIAILAGLVAILFPNFMDVRQRARDAQRKSDLKQLQKALEYYKQDVSPPLYPDDGAFPAPCTAWQSASGNLYMAKVPGDPNGTCSGTSYKYFYHRLDGPGNDGLVFDLEACLENKADPDGQPCTPLPPYFQNQTGYNCGTNWCYKVINP